MRLLHAFVERCGVLTGFTPLALVSLAAFANDVRHLADFTLGARRFLFKRDAAISAYDAQIPRRYACDAFGRVPPQSPQELTFRQLLRRIGAIPRETEQ